MTEPLIDRRKIPFVASSFHIYTCGDPACGPHLIGCDAEGVPKCEIIIGPDHVLSVCGKLLEIHSAHLRELEK